ncbi:RNA polymerase sigma factor [Chondromyces crocatus]|uniref:RNA polymerase sigma factor n=1 Tax=Chondromyces crocatus TaxID=52 RepID=UPI001C54D1BC|nr:sigma-70 family RNA polymerase sigma factor [Chondromyces crocatus]
MTGREPPAREQETPLDFDEVFRTRFRYVWNTLRRLGVRVADLEDLTHDVFVVVHRKRDRFDPTRDIRPWLFGIAANVASDYRRRAGHRNELSTAVVDMADPAPRPDCVLEERAKEELVNRALAAVEESRIGVFIMHDVDGVAMPEIVATLGIPLNTGYSRLRLARQDFSAAVKRLRAMSGADR